MAPSQQLSFSVAPAPTTGRRVISPADLTAALTAPAEPRRQLSSTQAVLKRTRAQPARRFEPADCRTCVRETPRVLFVRAEQSSGPSASPVPKSPSLEGKAGADSTISPTVNGASEVLELLDSAGGDSGSGNASGGDGGRGDGDEPEEGPSELSKLLAESRPQQSLPADLAQAIRLGNVSQSQLARYFKISQGPLGALMGFAGFRNRILADPKFLVKIGIEEVVGVTMKSIAEVDARKDKFWRELDFVISDLALEVCGDFALVWLLAPVLNTAVKQRPSAVSQYLHSLPSNAFQHGDYSLVQRAAGFVYKGLQFLCVGFGSAVLGQSATKGLVKLRSALNPESKSDVKLAPVFETALGWGSFMGLSSNTRYQVVNGIEALVIDPLLHSNHLASAAASFVLRTGNTFAGSFHWIWYAQFLGLQNDPEEKPAESEEDKE